MGPIRIAALLCLIAFPASPQSLAELAKKEKERRQKLPPSKVITDEDLKKVEGDTFSVTGVEAAPSAAGRNAEASANSGTSLSQKDRGIAELHARYQQRYESQKVSIARARENLADCQAARGIYILNRAAKRDCRAAEQSVRAAEDALRRIEDELMNEARKAGIPPGRVRLR
jgi:hypothetical protein